jgi:hypothetical protein
MPGLRDVLMSKGQAESALELTFDAETDSGVRPESKPDTPYFDITIITVRRMTTLFITLQFISSSS